MARLLSILVKSLFLLLLLLTLASSHPLPLQDSQDSAVSGVTVTVSQSGFRYAKSVFLTSILSERTTPFAIPDVNLSRGRVEVRLSNVELSVANVNSSAVDLDKTGVVTLVVGGVKARVRARWAYACWAAYVPFSVKDEGAVELKVNGLQGRVTFALTAHNGTLRLAVVKCAASIDDLEIEVEGRASWLYRMFVRAFEDEIRAAMDVVVLQGIMDSAEYLDNYLQALPRFLPVDGVSAMDVTIVQDPLVTPSFLTVGVRGEFTPLGKPQSNFSFHDSALQPGLSCRDSSKMVTIALSEDVVNSVARVYYEAGSLEWLVDELPQEAWLNTHFWRWLIPQLYRKYPNMDMALDFSCSAAPSLQLRRDGVTANSQAEVLLLVKSDGQSWPVACISLALSMDVAVSVIGNNIAAETTLNELELELSWSNIGRFPVKLLQPALRSIISRVILPILNKELERLFPLQVRPSVNLENVDIRYEEGFICICSDVHYEELR